MADSHAYQSRRVELGRVMRAGSVAEAEELSVALAGDLDALMDEPLPVIVQPSSTASADHPGVTVRGDADGRVGLIGSPTTSKTLRIRDN